MRSFGSLLPRKLGIVHYIFAAVLLVRLVSLVQLTASSTLLPVSGDTHFYDAWAQRIANGEFTDGRAFYGLPLYPFILAVLYKLVGHNPFVPGLLQICADSLTAVLIFEISRRVFSYESDAEKSTPPRPWWKDLGTIVGLVAVGGWALFMSAQAVAIVLMPTAWLTLAFWFVVWRVVRSDEVPGRSACFALGILIGFVAMGVATILFLLPLVAAAALLRKSPPTEVTRRAITVALLLFGTAVGSSPCWLHNTLVARDRVFLSAHSGINFWIGNNREATGYPHFPDGIRAGQAEMLEDSINMAEKAKGQSLRRSEVASYWSERARFDIAAQPLRWVKLLARKIANFWNAFEYDDLGIIDRLHSNGVILPGLRFGFVAVLGLASCGFAIRRFPKSLWITGAILLHMTAVLPVFVTERYRLAAVPGLLIFAAFGLTYLWQQVARLHLTSAAAFLLSAAAATAFVSMPRNDPGLWALKAFNSGRHALDDGDLQRAEQDLQRARAYITDNPETLLTLGNVHLARADRRTARQFYEHALALDGSHKRVLHNLGLAMLDENRPGEAETYLRRALAQEPDSATTRYLLAKALVAQDNRAAASRELEQALRLKPTQPEFLALREELARASSEADQRR